MWDECPYVPAAKRDDLPLEDPKVKSVEKVREIRDEIRDRASPARPRKMGGFEIVDVGVQSGRARRTPSRRWHGEPDVRTDAECRDQFVNNVLPNTG